MEEEQNPQIIDTDASIDNDTPELSGEFPAKPNEEAKQQSMNRSLLSIVLFIVAFHLFFKWEMVSILILVVVLLIHEAGHFLAMKTYKYQDLGIYFIPMIGALASGRKDTISQKQNMIILLSGPIPGIIIGTILYYFGLKYNSDFILKTSNIFIILNLFNLIPVMPLDGGQLIKSMFLENNWLINNIFLFLSILVMTYYFLYTHSYFLLIIPFYLLMQLSTVSKLKEVRGGLKDKNIDIDKTYEQLTDKEYWLIRDEIGTHIKYFSRFITPGQHEITNNEQRIVKEVKAILFKKPVKDLKIIGKILISFLWIMTFIVPIVVIAIYYISLGIKP